MSPDDAMQEAAVEQAVHPDLYEPDWDSLADDYAASSHTAVVVDNDNPWE